jgi:predicted KAP-like P-loop ATPase
MAERVDKLGRGEFVKFVKSLILNSDQYKRDNDCKSYVFALDSAWGTGKTYFLDLLCQDVTQEDGLKIVRYNAWKNDYCENAFEPLIYDILTSDSLSFPIGNEMEKENVKEFLTQIGKIGLVMGKQFVFDAAKNKWGIDLKDAFDAVKDSGNPLKDFLLRQSRELNEINQEREAFEKFKKSLGEATSYLKDNNQKLVVIIDELDRCKPTFAIQTLEVVKHLFDIDNIVFLFAVDIQQLSHSISSVYGQGFDSVGYLSRFFDYIAKLPEPKIIKYIEECLSNIQILSMVQVFSNLHILDIFVALYNSFNFSLRDLDTLIKSYKIMLNNFLFKYEAEEHYIYIFFLALKYKHPEFFAKIFVSKRIDASYLEDEVFKKIENNFLEENLFIKSAFELIEQDKILSECIFQFIAHANYDFKITDGKNFPFIDIICMGYYGNFSSKDQIYYGDSNAKNVLFESDLRNWKNIKHLTYREYIYKQLEMYNFFNPETVE